MVREQTRELYKYIVYFGEKITLKKGECLYPDYRTRWVYALKIGTVFIKQNTFCGEEVILKIIKDGHLYFDNGFDGTASKSIVFAKAPSIIYKVPKKQLFSEMNEAMTKELNCYWMHDSLKKDIFLREALISNKVGRIIAMIMRLVNSFGVRTPSGIKIDIKLTHEEWSQYCGTSRENVSRTLRSLKNKRLIQYAHSFIIVTDLDSLRKMIPCENCPAYICNTF